MTRGADLDGDYDEATETHTTSTAPAGFPYVLANILDSEPPDIITWSSTGRAFGIRNMAVFKTRVLPQYFKHDKFSSFQRQLNLYGFRKVNSLALLLAVPEVSRYYCAVSHHSLG